MWGICFNMFLLFVLYTLAEWKKYVWTETIIELCLQERERKFSRQTDGQGTYKIVNHANVCQSIQYQLFCFSKHVFPFSRFRIMKVGGKTQCYCNTINKYTLYDHILFSDWYSISVVINEKGQFSEGVSTWNS